MMDRSHLESEWERYAAGEGLGDEERSELLRALESDPVVLAEFLEDEKIRRTLSAFGRQDGTNFIASFLHRLQVEHKKTAFIRQVRARIAGESVPRHTRRRCRTDGGRRSWGIVLVAGGIVAVAAVWMILAFPSSRLPRPDRRERRGPAEVAAAAPLEHSRAIEVEKPEAAAKTRLEPQLRKEEPATFQEAVRETMPSSEPVTQPQGLPPKIAATPAPAPTGPSQATISTTVVRIECADGVSRLVGGGRSPLRTGEELPAGQGIEVDEGGAASLVYADQTRLDLGPGTLVKELTFEGGKRLSLFKGSLRARVRPQPAGEAMIVQTPHGEATVVGTTLEIIVGPDPKAGTQLEVTEGKVRFRNRLTGKAVDVEAGRFAVAASGLPLAALPQYRVVWALDLKNRQTPASVRQGLAAPGPLVPGNLLCLQSTPGSFGPCVNLALDQIVTSDPGRMRLRFRYFATGERMCVQLWCPRVEDNFKADIVPLIPSSWTSVDLPLSEFSRRSDGGKLRKGDLLKVLNMFVAEEGGAPVFWDRLELVERVAQ